MRHKHADLIHQIAEGATIQRKSFTGAWLDCDNPYQFLNCSHYEFRAKPGTENSGLPPGVLVGEDQKPGVLVMTDCRAEGDPDGFSKPLKSLAWSGYDMAAPNADMTATKIFDAPERTQLTVREQFAMAAMQAYIREHLDTPEEMARWSFEMAHAMLKASGVSDG